MKNNKGFALVPIIIVVLFIAGAYIFSTTVKEKSEKNTAAAISGTFGTGRVYLFGGNYGFGGFSDVWHSSNLFLNVKRSS